MWSARPIFISSTFLDMQAERDYLRTRVFPELEERLRARRHHLEWVDLRVGVATAAVRDEHMRELYVLKVCLDEVRRCRPFLIVLVGDRYGWVPPAERIRAAATEAGFPADVAGRSVTDLEIDFGVLADREQQPHSVFYFRDPLPYREMPEKMAALYSDAIDASPAAADRSRRLGLLKRRIETLLPDRVRRYSAGWDAEHQKVTGLEAWGRMVLDDIWTELDTATRAAGIEVEPPWQAIERNALDDFVEDRSREFVGRQGLLEKLTRLATAPTPAGGFMDGLMGVCVTGEAGSGQSALFGELHRRLGATDAFVLAHAAGASVASPSVDSMLRRWIDELAAALGTDPALAENAEPETVDATFSALIGRLALQRRVVVLIDALDQFEPTLRGRSVTWLPRSWPDNARLIATAIDGEASQALSERPGLGTLALPPLDAAEARAIVNGICDKYHRTFEPEVIGALLAKSGTNGPAFGNPLWLVLAVEELNLLDADDFAHARRAYAGGPGEQLRTLMVDITGGFPPDIAGIYGHTFERAEKLFGGAVTRGFLGLIAVSRAGWRERDFRMLLPRLSGEPWDELKFAQLRRSFRGQMRRRGSLAQWDFNHGQMRDAARARLVDCGARESDLHAIIAAHLLALPPDDPLHQSETMVHLLASENWAGAAHHYGGDLVPGELQGATQALISAALTPGQDGETSGPERVLRLLDATGADIAYQEYAAQRLLYNVLDPLRTRAPLDAQEAFTRRLAAYFDALTALDPALQARFDVHRAASHARLGQVQEARGRLADAEASLRRSNAVSERLTRDHPDVVEWQRDQSVGYNHIGELQLAQGNTAAAVASFRESLALAQRVASVQPDEPQWQRDLAISHGHLGDAQLAQGDAAGAQSSYQAALAISERLVAGAPGHRDREFDLSTIYSRLWRLQASRGDMAGAEASARSRIALLERLVDREPHNVQWRHALFVAFQNLSYVQTRCDHLAEAEAALRAAMSIIERLTRHDPTNALWLRDLSTNHHMLAELSLTRGNIDDAETSGRASLAISERLVRLEPGNADWQIDLVSCRLTMGRVYEARGNDAAADMAYRAGLAAAQQLGSRDPQNHAWWHQLALAHNFVAKKQRERGDFDAAEASLAAAVAVLREAVRRDPANRVDQNNLAACFADLTDVRRLRGDLAGAEQSCRAALAIVERLADRDSNNTTLLDQLAGCYHKLRLVQGERGDLEGAQATLKLLRAVDMRRDSLT
jgi:tetratricopeptide (TPR) repeat protein